MPMRFDLGQTARLRFDPLRQRYRPIPSALLAGSRYNQMGFNGYAGSNGTDTGSNSRVGSRNETGATITKLRAYFANWYATATNESAGFNDITVKAAVEYPAGTFTPLLFSASASATITAGNTLESDELTGLSIPAGATFWVRTYVTCTSGGKWPTGYLQLTTLGEAFDSGTATSDLTTSGTIVQGGATRGFGPVAVKATGFTGTPVKVAIAGVGDSIMMGSGDSPESAYPGASGAFAKAASLQCPFLNLGIAGTLASGQIGNFTRRLDLINRAGITDAIIEFGANDLAGSRSSAQIDSDLSTIAGYVTGLGTGIRVAIITLTPKTSVTTGAISSLTSAGTTLCTATVADTSYLFKGERVQIAGGAPAAYNGTFAIVDILSATQFTYNAGSIPGSSPATGSPTVSDIWQTQAKQTPFVTPAGAFTGGASSVRSVRNAAVRAGRPYANDWIEAADAVETARDSGIWKAGLDGATTHLIGSTSGTAQTGSTTTVLKTGIAMLLNATTLGTVTFTSGTLAGTQRTASGNSTAGDITLSSALGSAPTAGDAFLFVPYNNGGTQDGLHPAANVTGTPQQGGVYLLRDAVAAKITAWQVQ